MYCSDEIVHLCAFVTVCFTIFYTLSAVIATAPYDKKVFSDEFLDELKNEILRKVMPQDPNPRKFCLLFFLNSYFQDK